MKTVHAVFENGVFKPKEPVNLPERTKVEFEPRPRHTSSEEALDSIYEILGRRYDGGETNVAARHNEHQP